MLSIQKEFIIIILDKILVCKSPHKVAIRLFFSSNLDVWMVFCIIFVFGTLLEFALLIFLQRQIFDAKIKKSLSKLSLGTRNGLSRAGSRQSKARGSMGSLSVNAHMTMDGIRKETVDTTIDESRTGRSSLKVSAKRKTTGNGISVTNGNKTMKNKVSLLWLSFSRSKTYPIIHYLYLH